MMNRGSKTLMDRYRELLDWYGRAIEKAKRLKVPLSKVTAAFQAAVQALKGPIFDSIRSLLADIRGGTLGGATLQQQFTSARANFQNLLRRALGGDLDAMNQLSGAGRNLINLARQQFGTGGEFQGVLGMVEAGLQQVLGSKELKSLEQQALDSHVARELYLQSINRAVGGQEINLGRLLDGRGRFAESQARSLATLTRMEKILMDQTILADEANKRAVQAFTDLAEATRERKAIAVSIRDELQRTAAG